MRNFIITLFTTLSITAPSFSADTSSLTRLTDREDLFGWEAVGRVNHTSGAYCTGTLIANNLVLTAAHCVFDKKTYELRAPSSFTFQAGLRDGKFIEESKAAKIAVHKNYNAGPKDTWDNVRHDVALIMLERPISTFTASPFKLHTGAKAGHDVTVVSYGRGRDNAPSWQRNCSITKRFTKLMQFNCTSVPGTSGAPVLAKEGRNWRILSIIYGSNKKSKTPISYGMELPEIVSVLKKNLTHNGSFTSGRQTTQARRLVVGGNKNSSGAKFIKN